MRLVILTSETPANAWFVRQIMATSHDVAGIVIERPPKATSFREKWRRRRRMLQRHGLVRTANKLVYNLVKPRLGLLQSSDEFAVEHTLPDDALPVPRLVTHDVNSAECGDFIRSAEPQLLAVCGTRVICREIFSLASRGALNIHTGITPEYRSADPIFWALYRNEPNNVGVTVHLIDDGIDTGPILHQERIRVYADDSLSSLHARCIRRGAELYLRALDEIDTASAVTVDRSGAESHSYRSMDLGITEYCRFVLRFRRLVKRLPRRNPMASDDLVNRTDG